MKNIASRLCLSLAAIMALFAIAPTAQAAPSGFYLNPSGGTYQKDTSFSIQLRLNAGSNSGIQSNMDFDNSKLQILGVSTQGSALDNVTTTYDNNGGKISVYSVSGSSSGDRLITTITFRATAAGSAAINFARANQTLRYALLLPIWSDVATTNASYTIAGPVTPPSSGGGGSTNPPSSGNGNTSSPSPSTGNSKPASPQTTSPSPTPTGDGSSAPNAATPDSPIASQRYKSSPDFQTTQPDAEPWESGSTNVSTSEMLIPWLPIIVTSTLGLLTAGIFAAYRRTHLSKSLRRLLASVVSYKIEASEPKPVSFVTFPILAKIMPKLLAYTSPKLLATGIKQKLLAAGSTFTKRK